MNRNIDRLGIAKTLLVQILVLLALAVAAVRYVNWSSDVAWKEFISAHGPPGSGPNHHSPSQAPLQTVKSKAICNRKA